MNEQMEFPKTFDEFADFYGFKDSKEVYTNGSELIPVFRVKQWLEHCADREKGEWIPISERLPKERQAVLCWAESTAERPDAEFIGMYDTGDWFLQSDANHLSFPHQYNVVAWMPLPEPYMRGKADEDT